MKIIFAGTPPIAAGVLKALIDANYSIIACLTQPDRPQGRGLKLTPSAVKICALEHKIPILQPETLKQPEIQQQLRDLQPDLMIVMAYGLLLPAPVLQIPKLGCINLHASILPKWRGAAPIQYSILSGDTESGITIMQMDVGMDTGDILQLYPCKVLATDTSTDLHDRLALLAKSCCIDFIPKLINAEIKPTTQDHAQATYAHKIDKAQAQIVWSDSVTKIDRMIRAYNPWPIAYTNFAQQVVRIWHATIVDPSTQTTKATPGTIIKIDPDGIYVATGQGILKILQMQFPGKKTLPTTEILNSNKELVIGSIFYT